MGFAASLVLSPGFFLRRPAAGSSSRACGGRISSAKRTCVGCRTKSAKREFVRVVRTEEGSVEPDLTARRNGRGAYLCANADCWQEALTRDRLARALRMNISPENATALLRFAERYATVKVNA